MQRSVAGQGSQSSLSFTLLLMALACGIDSSDKCPSDGALPTGGCKTDMYLHDATHGSSLLQMKIAAGQSVASEQIPDDNDNDHGFDLDNNEEHGDNDEPNKKGLKGIKGVVAEVIKDELVKLKKKMKSLDSEKDGIIKVGRIIEKNRKYLDQLYKDVHMLPGGNNDGDGDDAVRRRRRGDGNDGNNEETKYCLPDKYHGGPCCKKFGKSCCIWPDDADDDDDHTPGFGCGCEDQQKGCKEKCDDFDCECKCPGDDGFDK